MFTNEEKNHFNAKGVILAERGHMQEWDLQVLKDWKSTYSDETVADGKQSYIIDEYITKNLMSWGIFIMLKAVLIFKYAANKAPRQCVNRTWC